MPRYRISKAAILDLDNIFTYTQLKWSTEQADKYYRQLIQEIDYVTQNFDLGRGVTQIRVGYKSSKAKSHVIFYRMGVDNVVEIVRILHERMDWKRHRV